MAALGMTVVAAVSAAEEGAREGVLVASKPWGAGLLPGSQSSDTAAGLALGRVVFQFHAGPCRRGSQGADLRAHIWMRIRHMATIEGVRLSARIVWMLVLVWPVILGVAILVVAVVATQVSCGMATHTLLLVTSEVAVTSVVIAIVRLSAELSQPCVVHGLLTGCHQRG